MHTFVTSDGVRLACCIDDFTGPWKPAQTVFLLHSAMSSASRMNRWCRISRVVRGQKLQQPRAPLHDFAWLSSLNPARRCLVFEKDQRLDWSFCKFTQPPRYNPTISESGSPGYEMVGWQSIVAPAGTPKEIVSHQGLRDDNPCRILPNAASALLRESAEATDLKHESGRGERI